MDLTRLGTGDRVLLISSGVFLLAMFLPWYGATGFEGPGVGRSGWSYFLFGIVPMLLILAVAATVCVLRFADNVQIPELPLPLGQIILIAAGVATALVLLKLLIGDSAFGLDLDRKFGIVLGFLSAAGVCVGAYLDMQQGSDDIAAPGSTPPQPF